MNFESRFKAHGSMYLESATYLLEEKKVVLEFSGNPERTVKYARVVFRNVEDYQEGPLKEQQAEELYDSLFVIKGGDSHSDRKEYFIDTDDREITFFSRDNPTMTRY